MSILRNITEWADSYLNTAKVPDYPNAFNGLQVENDGTVETIVSTVDASLNSIKKAVDLNADLIIAHHGLYWQGVEMLTGSWREKCKLLIEHNIALYSSHIPLDIHPEIGNNVLLAKEIGLKDIQSCLPWKGINLAVKGNLNKSRKQLLETLEEKLHYKPLSCLAGQDEINELYIITGGAGSEISKINALGGENFLSGEGSHWNIPYAEEQSMNLILASHYMTETFGVDALGIKIKEAFSLKKHEKIRSNCFL